MVSLLPFLMVLGVGSPDARSAEQVVSPEDYVPCGLVSLYLVGKIRGVSIDWEQLRHMAGRPRPEGVYSFEELRGLGQQLGLQPVGLRADFNSLRQVPMPTIAQMKARNRPELPPHFLVLLRVEEDGVLLLDAPHPPTFVPKGHFLESWTEILLVFPEDDRQLAALETRGGLRDYVYFGFGALSFAGALVFGSILLANGKGMGADACSVALRWRHSVQLGRVQLVLILSTGALTFSAFAAYIGLYRVPARCEVLPATIDLGQLSPGEHRVTLPVRNAGGKALQITGVRSSCTCAVVTAPEEVPPGETREIEVALSVSAGPGTAIISIASSDPSGPRRASIRWHGGIPLSVIPLSVSTGPAPNDREFHAVVNVNYRGGRSAIVPRLRRVDCDSPLVNVTEGRNDPNAHVFGRPGVATTVLGRLTIHVRVKPPRKAGDLVAACTLHFDCGGQSQSIHLPIRIPFTPGPLTTDVPAVSFASATPQGLVGQERQVEVVHHGGNSIALTEIPDWLSHEVEAVSQGRYLVKLTITCQPPRLPGPHRVSLHAKGVTPGAEATSLPVYAITASP